MLSSGDAEAIRTQISGEGALLAVLCAGQRDPAYGTTVRVERFSLQDQQASLTGVARQRFVLRRMQRGSDGLGNEGDVCILADLHPPRLPFHTMLVEDQEDTSRVSRKRLRPRYPSYWGYEQYAMFDASSLVARIQQMMLASTHASWFEHLSTTQASRGDNGSLAHYLTQRSEWQDPVRFAYWLAGNLPLTQDERLVLLRIHGIVALLRKELAMLERMEENVYCSRCGILLAETRDIFSMLEESPAGTFVNPHGFVFQILTLRRVQVDHVLLDNSHSTQDSWFPGYAWSIAYCRRCETHLGWRFDRVEDDLVPDSFFGFRRAALTQRRAVDRHREREGWIAQVVRLLDADSDDEEEEEDEDEDDEEVEMLDSIPPLD